MATTETCDTTTQIGELAGIVWHHLDEQGANSLTRLVKEVDAPRDLVMQALGWLAREEKLAFDLAGRAKSVRLR